MKKEIGLTVDETKMSAQAAIRLGISKCLLFCDGHWICDPRDSKRTKLRIGTGSTPELAIQDCAKANGIALLADGVKKAFTYRDNAQFSRVYLEGNHVGDIMQRLGGLWFYQPKIGGKADAGADMTSRNAVKKSLEIPGPK